MAPLLEYEDSLSSINSEQPTQEDDEDIKAVQLAENNNNDDEQPTSITTEKSSIDDRRSITSSPSSSTSVPSSSVRFRDDVRVREIPRLSDKEISDCWMSKNDYVKIKQECMNVVRMALARPAITTPSTTTSTLTTTAPASSSSSFVGGIQLPTVDLRGLENKTPCGIHRRIQNKTGAIRAVLNEQSIQFNRGIKDPDWLASVYKECSRRCSMEAKIMGMRDEIAITRDQIFNLNKTSNSNVSTGGVVGVGATTTTTTRSSNSGTTTTSTFNEHGLAAMKYYSTRLEI